MILRERLAHQSSAELETIFIGNWRDHFIRTFHIPAQEIIKNSSPIKNTMKEFLQSLPETFTTNDRDLIGYACDIAIVAHNGQMRKDENLPYVVHSFRVATLVAQQILDSKSPSVNKIVAAVLHDVIEDGKLRDLYGGDIDWPTYLGGLFQFGYGLNEEDTDEIITSVQLLTKFGKPNDLVSKLIIKANNMFVDGANWSAQIIEQHNQRSVHKRSVNRLERLTNRVSRFLVEGTGMDRTIKFFQNQNTPVVEKPPEQDDPDSYADKSSLSQVGLTQSHKIGEHFLIVNRELSQFSSSGQLFRPNPERAWEIIIKMADCIDNLVIGRTTFPKAILAAFLIMYGKQLGMNDLSNILNEKLNEVISQDKSLNMTPITRRIFNACTTMSDWLTSVTPLKTSLASDILKFLAILKCTY